MYIYIYMNIYIYIYTVIGVESSSVEGGTKVGVLLAPTGFVAAFLRTHT